MHWYTCTRLLLFVTGFLCFLPLQSCKKKDSQPSLNSIIQKLLPSSLAPWKLLSVRHKPKKRWQLWRWRWSNQKAQAFVRLYRPLTEQQAKQQQTTTSFLLASAFRDRNSPYPGVLSSRQHCPAELKPQKSSVNVVGGWGKAFQLFANKRFVYGACSKKLNHYRTYVLTQFCRKQQSYMHIEVFVPMRSTNNQKPIQLSFPCSALPSP